VYLLEPSNALDTCGFSVGHGSLLANAGRFSGADVGNLGESELFINDPDQELLMAKLVCFAPAGVDDDDGKPVTE
jgi:hypothetical protein